MTEKKQANVGDMADMLVVVRDAFQGAVTAIDEFLIKCVIEQTEAGTPKFKPEDYNALPWASFQTKKGQTWQRFSTAQDCADKNPVKQDLVRLCMSPNEATISAPYMAFGYGYWLFKD